MFVRSIEQRGSFHLIPILDKYGGFITILLVLNKIFKMVFQTINIPFKILDELIL